MTQLKGEGQVPEDEVKRILRVATSYGINLLDTAQAYGNAESILGHCWPKDAPRRLISKLPAGTPRQRWEESVITSLKRLKTTELDGFLLHRSSDLLSADGDDLLNWLESLRDRGLVKRIGVSIYEASELEDLPLDRLQLVQIPLSVYDQRLITDGTIGRLKSYGIAIHARSVFLQGLLLQPSQSWPRHLSDSFVDHHDEWLKEVRQQDLTPLAAALGFMSTCEELEAFLVGVQTLDELIEILQTWNKMRISPVKGPLNSGWENELDLDPRKWPKP